MLSTWRDPIRSFMDDFSSDVLDPFTTGFGDVLPKRTRRANALGLINLNALELENEFKVVAEIPGVQKDNIDVSVENGLLTIRVNKQVPDYLSSCTMHRNEIFYGSETRSIRIPKGYKEEPSGLQYKEGVLCACFPKSEEHEAKKLQIESA